MSRSASFRCAPLGLALIFGALAPGAFGQEEGAEAAPPSLHDLHERWGPALDEADRELEKTIAARQAAEQEPVDPLDLPKPLSEPGDGGRPMKIASHALRFGRRSAGIWREEIAAYEAARLLSADERGLMLAVADSWLDVADTRIDDGSDWETRLAEHAAAVGEAGTDVPLVRAFLAWTAARPDSSGLAVAPGTDAGGVDLDAVRELAVAADAIAADETIPPLFRGTFALHALRGVVDATGAPASGDGPLSVAVRTRTALATLGAVAASVTPEAAKARPQLPRILYELAHDLRYAVDVEAAEHAPYRLALLTALSDAAEAGADPYAFHCMAAVSLTASAWEARGGGRAFTVTQEGWEGFQTDLKAAARHGRAAWLRHPNLPSAPAQLIIVAKGQGDLRGALGWFREATLAQVDEGSAWFNVSEALTPKWGGSYEAQCLLAFSTLREDLLEAGVRRKGFDVLRRIDEATFRSGRGEPPSRPWQATIGAFADNLAQFPPTEQEMAAGAATGGWARDFGFLSRSLEREGMTERQLAVLRLWPDATQDPMQLRAMLDGYRRDYVAGPLAAAEGDAAAEAAKLARALDPQAPALGGDDLPRLRAAAEAVRAAADGDPVQLGWLEDVAAVLDRTEALAGGEPVALDFKPGLPGWRCQAMRYALIPPKELADDAAGDANGIELFGETPFTTPYVIPLGPLPEPFFLRARIESTPVDDSPGVLAGISLGQIAWEPLRPDPPAPERAAGGVLYLWNTAGADVGGYLGWLPLPYLEDGGFNRTIAKRITPGPMNRASFGLLAEPGRVATFVDQAFHQDVESELEPEARNAVPQVVQPVRLGTIRMFYDPAVLRIDSVRLAHRPGFTIPPGLTFNDLPPALLPPSEPADRSR